MVSTRSRLLPLLTLLLLSALLGAYTLTITVLDNNDNPIALQNTNVSILAGNTVLYTAKTNISGVAVFNLSAGAYFVKLTRGFYPDHIFLISISGDTPLRAVMLLKRESYILYGQVIDTLSSRWEGANISLIDSSGLVQRTVSVGANGYYIMPYLDTTKIYRLRLDAGPRLLSPPFSYDQPNTFYMPLDVRDNASLSNANPVLSAPESKPLYYPITATLMAGPRAMANESVSVLTPDGLLVLTTDATGSVHVNAATAGDYVFTYRNQTVTTTVAPLVMPTPIVPAPVEPSAPAPEASLPSAPGASSEQPPPSAGLITLGLGLGAIALIAIFCLVIFVAILAPKILKMLNGSKPSHPHPGQTHLPDHAPTHGAHSPEHKPADSHKLSGPGHQPHVKHKGKR